MFPFIRSITGAWLALVITFYFPPLASRGTSIASVPSSTLAGKVHNKTNVPLPGVVVALQGMPVTTTTNSAGDFLLACDEATPVLIFKCAGYQTQAVMVKKQGSLDITLYEVGTAALPPGPGLELVIENSQLEVADEPPVFPGGVSAYRAYMQQNFRYPEDAKAKGISGTVLVGFIVDEKGRILDAEVAKGVGAGLDQEALRLVRLMPWWTPGRRAGKPVRTATSLRIKFELHNDQ